MASTIVGYFEDYSAARRAEQDLLNSGFSSGEVQVASQSEDGMQLTESSHDSWWDRTKAAFGFADESELGHYQEATRRGGVLVTVKVAEERVDEAAAVLERHNPVDLDERVQSWQSTPNTKQTLTGVGGFGAAESRGDSEASIPLAEEQLHVGKRAVQRGALRVHTYVTERPVEEQVTLREERAFVDRRPVDRLAGTGEAAFQERTLEVREVGEEVVVSKEARVVEEVAIGKEQTSRTEQVRDKVRKTEVEVTRDGAKRP